MASSGLWLTCPGTRVSFLHDAVYLIPTYHILRQTWHPGKHLQRLFEDLFPCQLYESVR